MVIAVVLLVLLGLILWGQRRLPVVQYLYLTRYSLLNAVIVIGLAPFALYIATSLLQNLFVLTERWWEIALITWFAILAAWVVMTTLRLLLDSAPTFCLAHLR